MHTAPGDLPESAITAALADRWSLRVGSLAYQAVGFGSHHWDAVDDVGRHWFVTVDDLRARRLCAQESLDNGYERLRAALSVAAALGRERDFVVAPVPASDGGVAARLGDSFALAVYPFVEGERFGWGSFTPEHRRAVLELVVGVHSASTAACRPARVDDYAVQCRDAIAVALEAEPVDLAAGPYARPAADLLVAAGSGVRQALGRYDELVAALATDPPELVLTHGEPHPGNTMRAGGTWLLIDWDTVLLAPPERDLWDLDAGDGEIHAAYAAATGRVVRPDLMELYRLRWDLTDAALAVARFRRPHGRSADDEETWTILQETLATFSDRIG